MKANVLLYIQNLFLFSAVQAQCIILPITDMQSQQLTGTIEFSQEASTKH